MKNILVQEQTMDEVSEKISEIINSIKNNKFLEGVYYFGTSSPNTIFLSIVYNDFRFNYPDTISTFKVESESIEKFNLKIESIPYWWYYIEEYKKQKQGYPLDFSLRYGEILYDKNGNLTELKHQLEKDESIEGYLRYWKETCEFDPPIQYIKKNNS